MVENNPTHPITADETHLTRALVTEVPQNGAQENNPKPMQGTIFDNKLLKKEAVAPLADNNSRADAAGPVSLETWIGEARAGEVFDYTASKDQLMLVWDDTMGEAKDPDVEVVDDPIDPNIKRITMNGKLMAEVYGDPNLNASDVAVIPLSAALIIGLEPN